MNADGGAALADLEDRRQRHGRHRPGPIMVSSQLAKLDDRRASSSPWPTSRPASSRGRRPTSSSSVNKAVDFPGEAQVTLIGLPNKVTTDVKTITKDTKEIVFRIKTDKVSPAGNHQNLFCQVVVIQDGEPIVHNLGSGQLRIDVPLPPKPKPAAAPAPVAAAAPPKPAAPAAEKR